MTPMARWIAILAIAAAPGSGPAQEPQAPRPTGRISGVVVAADTGRPVDGAVVELTHDSPGKHVSLAATTRGDGAFSFERLIPGTFILTAGAPRYNAVTYRRSPAADAPIRHTLEEGQQVALTLMLPRLGSFGGRVLDQYGDPVPGIGVFALERRVVGGIPRLVRAGRPIPPRLTDDLGQFRLAAFPPGQYYLVAVSGALTASPIFNYPNEAGGFLPTYYPGTSAVAEAQPLTLGAGQDIAGLTITAIDAPMHRVSGAVVDSSGERLPSASIAIVPVAGLGAGVALGGRTQAGADGTFVLSNVPPGAYVIQAFSQGASGAGPGEFGWSNVTVGQSDVADLRLSTVRPATLRGRVRFEPATLVGPMFSSFELDVPAVDFETQPALGSPPAMPPRPRPQIDGSFEISGLWGRRLLRVRTSLGAVERILMDGKDVTDTPIEFNGRDRVGIEVVLTRRTGTVAGRATTNDGKAAVGCQIVVFSTDADRWTPHSRFVAIASADGEGQFRVHHLLPGNYLAAALPADTPWHQDPAFLELLRSSATSLAVTEQEVRELELTVVSDLSR